uniref:Glucose-6-phosphate isomerase n=1 Tax=Amorphochlora amoebiformis TaxID=1561963 RepID=A0A7S0CTX8_9EUKA|mmetsp:Transcript_12264/g.19429  ORF Transcript_12264/g.19429 Transcript_12264/m.19429 type:complete len:543 (+) Transcript_12264:139-1767(+)
MPTKKIPHLKQLMEDQKRVEAMTATFEGLFLDYSRQCATSKTMELLFDLALKAGVLEKFKEMASGKKINTTEGRAVMHMALRADPTDKFEVDGKDVVKPVHEVLSKIKAFSEKVRSGAWKGSTGKPITNIVAVGIGGSYLGAEFVAEALSTGPAAKGAEGRTLRFLANVDPVAVERALRGLKAESTMVVVISKTFTTAETMLNARTLRKWIVDSLGEKAVPLHMIACSASPEKVKAFGINPNNMFTFWSWVGGRYSVSSAVGMMPLALHYGFDTCREFLKGLRSVDRHLLSAPPRNNLPLIMGLLGVWNSSFLGHKTRAIACYAQAMLKFAPHIQQVDMESNGKRVSLEGITLPYSTGEVNFGEPGTNGQHSFYQLFHQGQVVPVDFIGFIKSNYAIDNTKTGETVSNHDELMSNFFAQPDALAYGKGPEELKKEGVAELLIPHKTFPGNRPSNMLLVDSLTPYSVGQMLGLYEHRTGVQGFIWGINSFDQFGVELGKVLGKKVRKQLQESRQEGAKVAGFNASTTKMLQMFLAGEKKESKL